MRRVRLRFYAELRDFLPPDHRAGRVTHRFDVPGSVKDAIEACGVPHTEVDLVLANGESVDFSYRLEDGDRVSVYPVFECLDISSLVKVRPRPLRQVRFVLDGHLGRLARFLRLVGLDSLWSRSASDPEPVDLATGSGGILLTRDRGLLKRSAVTHGYCVRATDPKRQLLEVVRRFHLAGCLAPLTRCMRCNGVLEDVEKGAVADRLPARTREHFDRFRRCRDCAKVYWRGAHHPRLAALIDDARRADR